MKFLSKVVRSVAFAVNPWAWVRYLRDAREQSPHRWVRPPSPWPDHNE